MHPALWEPPSPVQQRLKRLARRRVALDEMRVQESNRLGAPGSSDVRSSIQATLSFFDRQIDEIDSQIRSLIDDDPTFRSKRELLDVDPGHWRASRCSRLAGTAPTSASFGAPRRWPRSLAPRRPLQTVPGMATSNCTSPSVVKFVVV